VDGIHIYVSLWFDLQAPLQSRAYGLDGSAGVTNPALPGLSGLPARARARAPGPCPLEDPPLPGRSGLAPAKAQVEDPALARSSSLGKSAGILDVEHHKPLSNLDGPSEDESNILFVDGLPSDCTRREVARILHSFPLGIIIIFLENTRELHFIILRRLKWG
jgi:hypothetical protein